MAINSFQDNLTSIYTPSSLAFPTFQSNIDQAQPLIPLNQLFQQQADVTRKTNPTLANQFQALSNDYNDNFLQTGNVITWLYNDYNNLLTNEAQTLQWVNQWVWNDIISRLNEAQNIVVWQYWPQWKLTNTINDYYNWLYWFLNQQWADQIQAIANEWIRRWSSIWAIRAAQASQNKSSLDNYLKAKNQEIGNLDNLYKTYNSYIQWFLNTYWATKDKYLVDIYRQLFNARNQVWQQLLWQQQNLLSARLQDQLNKKAQADAFARQLALTKAATPTTAATPEQTNASNLAALIALNNAINLKPTNGK